MIEINLKKGFPTVEMAMISLRQSLVNGKARGAVSLKIIHGYGSTGKGGAIRSATYRQLVIYKEAGKIKEFVQGDAFSPFYPAGRAVIKLDPLLTQDQDYIRTNQGITIVIL